MVPFMGRVVMRLLSRCGRRARERNQGEDMVAGDVEKSAVGYGLRLSEGGEDGGGVALGAEGDVVGEVDLVGVASLDVVLDAVDLFCVVAL